MVESKKKTFTVSLCLITTFVLFYIVPNFVHSNDDVTSTTMIALTYTGLIVDPVLYTLLHPTLRNIAAKLFTCCCCCCCCCCCSGDGSQSMSSRRKSPLHSVDLPKCTLNAVVDCTSSKCSTSTISQSEFKILETVV